LTSLFFPSDAFSQTAAPSTVEIINRQASNSSLFSFDYGVPTSPALSLAGLATDKTGTSTSLKPFVLSLPGLFGSSSSPTSASFDASAAWLLNLQGSTALLDTPTSSAAPDKSYQDDYFMRLEYRTRVGVALYRGDNGGSDPTKEKPSRLALGLSTSLLDTSDPVMATLNPFKSAGPKGQGAVWNSCLDSSDTKLKPYITDQDNKRSVIARDQAVLTRYLIAIGGSNGGSPDDVDNKLSDSDKTTIKAIEGDLKQVGLTTTIAAGDNETFDRKRLSSDAAATDTYIHNRLPDEIFHDTQVLSFIQGCDQNGSAAAQHGADLELGVGAVLSGQPGEWSNFGNPNFAVWLSGRIPLQFRALKASDCTTQDNRSPISRFFSCWMIGGSGRYSADEIDATGNKTTPLFAANVAEGWAGIERVDANSKVGGYFGYARQTAVNAADSAFSTSGHRWLVSGAYSLSFLQQGLWIEGSYGSTDGTVSTLKDHLAMLTLSFGPPKIGSGFVSSAGNN
jgi:hypothetical protein